MLKRRLAGKSRAKKQPDDDDASAAASDASKKEDRAKKKRRGSAKVAVDDAGDGDGDDAGDAAADDGDAPGGGRVAAPDRPDTTGPGDVRFAWRFNYRHS